MPVINKFDGGIITGLNDMYLEDGQATVLTNVDIERTGLLSFKESTVIGRAQKFFYEFPVSETIIRMIPDPADPEKEIEEEILKLVEPPTYHVTSASRHTSYTEFEGKLCCSDGGPQCKFTEGEMNDEGTGFKWLDMGVAAPEGKLITRPLSVEEDIGLDVATLISNGQGYLDIDIIKYRVVHSLDFNYDPEDDPSGDLAPIVTVYTHEIEDNPGGSLVDWVLPDDNYRVYREIVDEYGEHTDHYAAVGVTVVRDPEDEDSYTVTTGTFIDGGSDTYDKYNYVSIETIYDNSSHRLCYVDDVIYSVPFRTARADDNTVITTVSMIYALNENEGTWQGEDYNLSIVGEGTTGIASGFVYGGELYVMVRSGDKLYIYDRDKNIMFSGAVVNDEFFKCTPVEHNNILYMFDPQHGKVISLEKKTDGLSYTEEGNAPIVWLQGGIWDRPSLGGWIAWFDGVQISGTGTAPYSVDFSGVTMHRDNSVQAVRSEGAMACVPDAPRTVGYRSYVDKDSIPSEWHFEINIKNTDIFPFAFAEDSVYTVYKDKVYALINNKSSASIRTYNIPDFDVENVGPAELTVEQVRGLGGSAGCDFTYGDFQVFPVMGGVVTFNRNTNLLSFWENPKAVSGWNPKGFSFSNSFITLIAGPQMIRWLFSDKTVDYELFDFRTLTGS